MKLIKNNKKILVSLMLISSILISDKALAQYPVAVEYIDPSVVASTTITQISPQVRFWVTNFDSMTSSSTLFTKDETLINLANKLLLEEKRHNQWVEDYTKVGAQANKELARDLASELFLQTQQMMTNFVVAGFNKSDDGTGNPAYVTDEQNYMDKVAKSEAGIMYNNDFNSDEICDTVKKDVKKAMGKESSKTDFQKEIKCTLEEKDADPTKEDDMKTWEDWYNFSQPENNPVGAFILSNTELDARIKEKENVVTNELNRGKGALSLKLCQAYKTNDKGEEEKDGPEFYGDPIYEQDLPDDTTTTEITEENSKGYKKTVCTVVTPGSLIDSGSKLQGAALIEKSATDASLADGTTLIGQTLANKQTENVISEIEYGFLNEITDADLDSIAVPLVNDGINQDKASYTQLNPFSPTDIYNPNNSSSPYNESAWFNKWGGGDAFDIVNMINGYTLIDYPANSQSEQYHFNTPLENYGQSLLNIENALNTPQQDQQDPRNANTI